ncbi:hypothetical protein AB9P05_05015 [Roseivirga sp. BDSF3-8]|uniref:hypothetical protein n=1 Tax=Roseivirga sp. BDSF3-8 TaxID=3241598 RepID=UPI003531A3AD
MAIIENNPWIEGARGMVRNAIVYRQRAGRTIVSARPAKSSKPLSDKQKAHHRRFKRATGYAKSVGSDERMYALYKAGAHGFNSWQNVAVKDYMHAPVVDDVFVSEVKDGRPACIRVYAHDDFHVASLSITLRDAEGVVLEGGEASTVIVNGVYEYRLTGELPGAKGLCVTVVARDLPGNETVYDKVLIEAEEKPAAEVPVKEIEVAMGDGELLSGIVTDKGNAANYGKRRNLSGFTGVKQWVCRAPT